MHTDVCLLQYHNCHENATCQLDTEGFCVCNPGFIGDGMSCENICNTNMSRCHTNATCQVDNMDVVCTCHPGFTGDGHSCTEYRAVVSQCELECPEDNMRCTPGVVEYCSCEPGAVLQESQCIQSKFLTSHNQLHSHGPTILSFFLAKDHTGTECHMDSLAGYQWPATVVGTTAYVPCTTIDGKCDLPGYMIAVVYPDWLFSLPGVSMGNVSRECSVGGVWGALNAPMCVSPAVHELQRRVSSSIPRVHQLHDVYCLVVLPHQRSLLLTDRSADPDLTAFTADLLDVTMEIVFAGDIPQIVDLLHFSIDVLGNVSSRSSIPSSHLVY